VIERRYAQLVADVYAHARECGRADATIEIVAVSKRQPADAIVRAAAAGVMAIGENYLQEAQAKFAALGDLPLRKHYLGHVQTNKAKGIAQAFDVVQSVDRLDAGVALSRAAGALGKRLPVLLQLNISPSDRYGCLPQDAQRLAEAIREMDGLALEGIMAIGPVTQDRDEIVRSFELAAKTLGSIGGSTLSIGMSGDWREAVRAGSTMLRLGTALFGPRSA
jgi:pyridoxal phosphate enzyme (YggS family)